MSSADLRLLLCHLTSKDSAWLYAHLDHVLSQEDVNQINHWVDEMSRGKPLAYITGEKDFWTLKLKVNEHTLIPRPDTEIIIETILLLNLSPNKILDLGTGSGAIALALATEYPSASIVACDYSNEALLVAQANAQLNHIDNVKFIESDWFDGIDKCTFDLIVSNPPYIDTNDPHLIDLAYEPLSALVAEDQGLADFKTISEQATEFLQPDGILMFEHGWQQSEAVRMILNDTGFTDVTTQKDLAGHDRVTWGRLKA